MRNSHPTFADVQQLSLTTGYTLTAYVRSDPTNDDFTRTSVKSALDNSFKQLREQNPDLHHSVEQSFRTQFAAILDGDALTHALNSLAIFVTPDSFTIFALHNRLPELARAGGAFTLGPLFRAVTVRQHAFILTLAPDAWNLWQATPDSPAAVLHPQPDAPTDVSDATNRATVRDRSHVKRLVGSEGQKLLLERYVCIIIDAIHGPLDSIDPRHLTPLFIFASEPILSMAMQAEHRRPVIAVHGASNELTSADIERAIRPLLSEHNTHLSQERVAHIADGIGAHTAVTDLNDITEAATAGAVETFFFDYSTQIPGSLNSETGSLTITETGDDVLTKLALVTLEHGGTVQAIRRDEVPLPNDSPALAQLRYPL